MNLKETVKLTKFTELNTTSEKLEDCTVPKMVLSYVNLTLAYRLI